MSTKINRLICVLVKITVIDVPYLLCAISSALNCHKMRKHAYTHKPRWDHSLFHDGNPHRYFLSMILTIYRLHYIVHTHTQLFALFDHLLKCYRPNKSKPNKRPSSFSYSDTLTLFVFIG